MFRGSGEGVVREDKVGEWKVVERGGRVKGEGVNNWGRNEGYENSG